MKKLRLKFAPVLLSIIAAAALVACGGGGGDAPAAPLVPVDIAATIAATVTATGATVIPGAADEETYNVAADIGDSWQIVLNTKANTFVVKVVSSKFGLSGTTSPVAFTKAVAGTITTYTGTGFSVQVDSRTRSIGGNVTVGAKKATVAGTAYVVADTTKLAGTYLFFGAARNVDGSNPDSTGGSFVIAANGADITVCDGGIISNGTCTNLPGDSGVRTVRFTLSKDSAGLLRIKQGTVDFGILNVSPGDRGPVLVIDRFGPNESNITRVGAFYAVKPVKLAGNEFDGSWTCDSRGANTRMVDVSGSSYSVTGGTTPNSGTLIFNQVVNVQNQAVDLDGAIIAQNKGETLSQSSGILPLSTSLVVVEQGQGDIAVCRKNK